MSDISLQRLHFIGDTIKDCEENFLTVDHCTKIYRQSNNLKLKKIKDDDARYIMYLYKGTGNYTSKIGKSEIPEGSLIISSKKNINLGTYAIEMPSMLYVLCVSGYGLKEQLKKIKLEDAHIISIGEKEKIVSLYDNIFTENKNRKMYWADNITAHILELFANIGRAVSEKESTGVNYLQNDFNNVIQIMNLEYNQWHEVSYYAKKANLSLYRFIHKFKEETGMTPIEYITDLRIKNAKNLIENTSLKICEVASVVGYENPLYFSRVFKKITGISPSKYSMDAASYL